MLAPLALGAAVGVVLGLLGGGGSILAVPALVYGLGQPVGQAVPTSLLVVAVAAGWGASTHWRDGEVRWRLAVTFAAAGALAALAGAAAHRALDEDVVLAGFGALMLAVAGRMLRPGRPVDTACAVSGGRNWRGCLPVVLSAGAGVGFLTGLFGVGGGFVVVPALVLLVGLPMPAAIGTSLLVVALNAGVALLAHWGHASLDPAVTAVFGTGAVAGSLLGARLAVRSDPTRLRTGFALLVLGVGAFVLVETLLVPRLG